MVRRELIDWYTVKHATWDDRVDALTELTETNFLYNFQEVGTFVIDDELWRRIKIKCGILIEYWLHHFSHIELGKRPPFRVISKTTGEIYLSWNNSVIIENEDVTGFPTFDLSLIKPRPEYFPDQPDRIERLIYILMAA